MLLLNDGSFLPERARWIEVCKWTPGLHSLLILQLLRQIRGFARLRHDRPFA